MIVDEMSHFVPTPHGIVDIDKAYRLVETLGIGIALIHKQGCWQRDTCCMLDEALE